ncbi:MAG: protein-L-isoaspartate O-methyltransferase [Xanthomonadales bacterium]|nr:protein-L-isoaspartate O-methyltransferase [Xanthomonadales bacterium]
MVFDFDKARLAMIEQQIRPWEVLDPRVLDTLRSVPREEFVPPALRKLAFSDLALPLPHGQVMMRPVVEGRMLQALAVEPDEAALEIGTGSGFIAACLGHLAHEALSVEIFPELAAAAAARLERLGFANVRVLTADALGDFAPGRPFDAIAVTGAVERVPQRFLEWLAAEGRLFAVEGRPPAMEAVLYRRQGERAWRRESLFETELPYLIGAEPKPRFTL